MIKVFEPDITIKDKFAVYRAMSKKNISGTSPEIDKFEKSLSNYFDRKYVSTVSNGSSALDLALKSIDLNDGDEVIVPSFTIISCLAAIIRAGGKPIFCDVDINSWNMRLSDVEKVITDKTRAILMVHTYGLVAEAKKISQFCNEKNLILIEDAAEAHGQIIDGQKCGSFGIVSTLSFYANKHVTSGEGGAVLTDDKKLINKINQMKNLDFTSQRRFFHENLYWNYRLGSLQAALGESSLKKIDNTIKLKIKNARKYDELFSPYTEYIQTPLSKINSTENHYWVYGIVLKTDNSRDDLISYLMSQGIETRPFFWPLHKQKAYKDIFNEEINCTNSELLGRNGLYIPIGSHMTSSLQEKVVKEVVKGLKIK